MSQKELDLYTNIYKSVIASLYFSYVYDYSR